MQRFPFASLLALLVPAALLAGAFGSQYLGGLYPCEMCLWQRWPHAAAILLAVAALLARPRPAARVLTALAALAIITSGALGAFHAGVEYHWWQGPAHCSAGSLAGAHGDILAQIMATPLVRCDEAQWRLLGISLAGWNALVSLFVGGLILWLLRPSRR